MWNRRCCQGVARRPSRARRQHRPIQRGVPTRARTPPNRRHPPRGLRDIEHAALRERAAQHRGSRAALAAELGISERSLYRKLKAAGAA